MGAVRLNLGGTMTIDELVKLPTRKLLSMLKETYSGESYYMNEQEWEELDGERRVLKEVLATREHIPNKMEAKRIRQERAKKKT